MYLRTRGTMTIINNTCSRNQPKAKVKVRCQGMSVKLITHYHHQQHNITIVQPSLNLNIIILDIIYIFIQPCIFFNK